MRPINRNTAPHLVACAFLNIRARTDTLITRLLAWWWCVDIAPGCRFLGIPMFRRLPMSRIDVGPGCLFCSAKWSNFMGLNHGCILTTLNENAKIKIGSNCGFSGTTIAAAVSVSIGDRVMTGANSIISDTDWHPVDSTLRANKVLGPSSPVVLESDVWLGANVLVLKGVTIGKTSIISANSVVTKSIPSGVIAGGVPARVLRNIE